MDMCVDVRGAEQPRMREPRSLGRCDTDDTDDRDTQIFTGRRIFFFTSNWCARL